MNHSKLEKNVALATIIIPFISIIFAIYLYWGLWVNIYDICICLLMYFLTMLGITLGYHRFFTHKSFKCTTPIKYFLGIFGCMAAQGPIYFWVATHRKHHQCSDREGDPHSPHHGFLPSYWGTIKGLWHSHIGWMISHNQENYRRLIPDIIRDKSVNFIDKNYFLWVALGILVPGITIGAVNHSLWCFVKGCLWGGLIRIFLVHHSTWSVNSICHLFGNSPFKTHDESKNNFICAVLTLGEGWHNNHHAFPSSSRHGLFWWQIDIVYLILRMLSTFGLAWDLIEPEPKQIAGALSNDKV